MTVRVLALDHYFDQDLSALEAHLDLDVRRISYARLRRVAVRMMGEAVAASLEAFSSPDLDLPRQRYAAWLAQEVRRMYLERSFDVVVLPSDTFFYVRALPAAAHELGIPVVVVQKETIISPDTLETDSLRIARHAPFTCDLMTACSEAHRAFWIRSGADGGRILVTGQPRFDVYAQPHPRPGCSPPRVLFLSYQLDAYEPGVAGGRGRRTWEPLRAGTEQALIAAARAGACTVVVKPHPQQPLAGDRERLRAAAGDLWGTRFVMVDPEADTRRLIFASDAVVGFQTTALYEAVAAGRPTIYAAWGEAYQRHRTRLIAYHGAPDGAILHATGREHLVDLVASHLPPPGARCRPWLESAMGPLDGRATGRVAETLARVAAAWPAGPERRAMDRSRSRFAARLLVRSVASTVIWTTARGPAGLAGRSAGAQARLSRAAEWRRLALEALRSPG